MSSEVLEKARSYEKIAQGQIGMQDRPAFHLCPRTGWMNDPNGFSYYQGMYHLFYQYYPYEPCWGSMHWGHAVSSDLLHWSYRPAALAPDQPYDLEGCFSGSALELPDGRHLLMYTGVSQTEHPEGGTRCAQTQCLAFGNGTEYEKYAANPVIDKTELPKGASKVDFRDPKLWREVDGAYHCVTASCDRDSDGQILLFGSSDGVSWSFESVLAKNGGRFGKIWECPDFFELDGRQVLLVSPMEMEARDLEYRSGNGAVCMLGTFDREQKRFMAEQDQAIDYGIDFYAPQTVQTPDGRRVMIAWMQNWDTWNLYYPDVPWRGQMTIPRELCIRDSRLCQRPIRELEQMRKNRVEYSGVAVADDCTLEGIRGRRAELEVFVRPTEKKELYRKFEMRFAQKDAYSTVLRFDPRASILELDRGLSGGRHAAVCQCRCRVRDRSGRIRLRLILDRFSAELFVNDGEQVMTIALFTDQSADGICFGADGELELDVIKYDLGEA